MSVPISNRTKRIMKLVNQVSTENVDNRMDVLHTDVFITSNLGKVIEEAEVIFENEFGGTGQKESTETVLLADNNVRIPENFGKSANEDTNTEIIFTTTDMNVLEEMVINAEFIEQNVEIGPNDVEDTSLPVGDENDTRVENEMIADVEVSSQENTNEQLASPRKRSKHHEVDKNKWKIVQHKNNREKGNEYLGRKKVNGQWKYDIMKSKRRIKQNCHCKLSESGKSKLLCNKLRECQREKIFKRFWKLSWNEKKVLVNSLVIQRVTARKRGKEESSRRQLTNEFYLKSEEGNVRVCKKMFLNTLGVGEWVIKSWVKLNSDVGEDKKNGKQRGKGSSENIRRPLVNFFEKLPKLESHYCRVSTSKFYLEPMWKSKSDLYKFYKNEFCKENSIQPVCMATFSQMFDKQNLSLYYCKKDKCDVCVAYETKNLSEAEYSHHMDRKKEARQEKSKDKESTCNVFTVDLQSVLLSPKSTVSSLYYKTKLIVHNYTIYDIKRKEGYCYIWNECEGGLGSNEFSTILVHFLEKFLSSNPDKNTIVIWSDGCGYQNRNVTLSNALFNLVKKKEIIIIQKYMQKGHTQMEVDSMHSTIERKLRRAIINVPADYVGICKSACSKSPYHVEYLIHPFFKNFEQNLRYFKSIRPGKVAGDPTVNDIKEIKYTSDMIFYKLRHSEEEDWKPLPVRMDSKVKILPFCEIPALYKCRLKISKEKYDHLQQLKRSIQSDYHKFYDDLPHS